MFTFGGYSIWGMFVLGAASFAAPQVWAIWGLLAFRRDWDGFKTVAAALAAALVQTLGGACLGIALLWIAPDVRTLSLLAVFGVLVGILARSRAVHLREEAFRMGRETRWPIVLALWVTGPSEVFGAAVAWYARSSGIGLKRELGWAALLWGIGAFLGATAVLLRAKENLEHPGRIDALLPTRPAETLSGPGVWVPVGASIVWALAAVRLY